MNMIDFYRDLNKIPFLKLGEINYTRELKQQALNYDHTLFQPFKVADLYDKPLGVDIIPIYDFKDNNPNGNSHRIPNPEAIKNYCEKFNLDNWPAPKISTIGEKCPLIRKAVDDFIEVPSRTRLSLLPRHSNVIWHSHSYLHKIPNLTEIVLHLPIQTDKGVVAKVKRSHTDDTVPVFEQHFAEGELWYLNTYYFHCFENTSDIDRYHIWYNCMISTPKGAPLNQKIIRLLQQAVEKYNGPYIT